MSHRSFNYTIRHINATQSESLIESRRIVRMNAGAPPLSRRDERSKTKQPRTKSGHIVRRLTMTLPVLRCFLLFFWWLIFGATIPSSPILFAAATKVFASTSALDTDSVSRHYRHHPRNKIKKFRLPLQRLDGNDGLLLSHRGGDLGPVSAMTLARTITALSASDALLVIVSSITNQRIVKNSRTQIRLQYGIGSSATSMAVSLFWALFPDEGTTTLHQIVGYGFLARWLFLTTMMATKTYVVLGIHPLGIGILWSILTMTVYALLLVEENQLSLTLAMGVSLWFILDGTLELIHPKLLRPNNEDDLSSPKELVLARSSGGYRMINGAVLGLLAMGVDPIKVPGVVTLLSLPILWNLAVVVKVRPMVQLVVLVSLSVMTAGMLL